MDTIIADNVLEKTQPASIRNMLFPITTPRRAVAEPFADSRHTRINKIPPVQFDVSHDPALLHQYYQVRAQMFIREWQLSHFPSEPDSYDLCSDTIIAHAGKMCVGGLRLTFSRPGAPQAMAMESDGFQLRELLPELDLEHKTYAECTRMALLPDFRTKEISFLLRCQMIRHCMANNVDYVFWISPMLQARNYRQTMLGLDFPCTIRQDVKVPDREEYEGLKMYLGVVDLTQFKNTAIAEHSPQHLNTKPEDLMPA